MVQLTSAEEAQVEQEAATTLTAPREGFSAAPYQDPGGIWTYLYGSTRDPNGKPVTADTPPGDKTLGIQLLERDLRAAIQTIEAEVKVPLTQNEEAALADFIYNVGAGNFDASTLLRLLNAGDYTGAAEQLLRWNQQHGVVLAGLVLRRQAEETEFLKQQPDLFA